VESLDDRMFTGSQPCLLIARAHASVKTEMMSFK